MLIEPTVVDANAILRSLAAKRPVFHSEADFRFAFAWEAKVQNPELEVRLETHPEPSVRLDLELITPRVAQGVAVELKYLTAGGLGTRTARRSP